MTSPRWPIDAGVEAAVDTHRKAVYEQDLTHHEAMRAALLAADRAAWQPIETAPKDGTDVLVVSGDAVFQAYWADGYDYLCKASWAAFLTPDDYKIRDARLWRPLPAPPARGDGE